VFFVCGGRPRVTKNPQPLPAVGFVKVLRSTSASGVANYDDYQTNGLTDVFQHCGSSLIKIRAGSSSKSGHLYRNKTGGATRFNAEIEN
jgi:hypothetical protein